MNRILIIGGNGFIGKNISNYLDIMNVDHDIYDVSYVEGKHKCYQGNILTDDNLDNILANYDTVIYLVTSVSPKKSMDFPESSYTQDIPMLIRTLDSCVKNNVKRVIFSSSGGTVYGEGNNLLNGEQKYEEPINHYAICKLACEKILLLYNKLHGMENIILRIANPYGIGQKVSSGVGAITAFTEKILANEKITLFGDGSISRDFIHIEKVCEAVYLSCNWKFDKSITPIFNIGSGQALSLNDIINIIATTLNTTPKIDYQPERDFDVKYNVLDISKAEKYLGYKVEKNELEYISEYVKQYKKDYSERI